MTANGDILYERVTPANPTADQLAAVVGEYESRETASVVKVELGSQPGELRYRVGVLPPVTLRPAFQDVFSGPGGISIRFIRDAPGNVSGLSAGDSRVWDLRFNRVR